MFEQLEKLRGKVVFVVTKAGTVRTLSEPDYSASSTKVCGDCPIVALAKQTFGFAKSEDLRRLEHVRVSTLPAYWRNLDAANLGTILLRGTTEDVVSVILASDRRDHPLRPQLLNALGVGL